MAEGQGFEPWGGFNPTLDFESSVLKTQPLRLNVTFPTGVGIEPNAPKCSASHFRESCRWDQLRVMVYQRPA